jgi:hypothetical protein
MAEGNNGKKGNELRSLLSRAGREFWKEGGVFCTPREVNSAPLPHSRPAPRSSSESTKLMGGRGHPQDKKNFKQILSSTEVIEGKQCLSR